MAEENLQRNEIKFQELFRDTFFCYQSLDENGHIIHVNKAWLDEFGYSRKQVTGRWFGDFLTPNSRNRFRKHLSRLKTEVRAHDLEYEMIKQDGSPLYVEYNEITFGRNKKIMHTHCILINKTDYKKLEEEMRENEKRFQSLFEEAPIGISIVNSKGQLLEFNQSLQEILGYSNEELQNMVFTEFTHPDDQKKDRDLWRDLFKEKRESYCLEKRLIRKNGKIAWGHLTTSLVTDALGRPQYGIRMVEDITDYKRTMAKLKKSESNRREQEQALERKNIALSEIIKQVNSEKRTLNKNIDANIEHILLPILKKIKLMHPDNEYIDLLKHRLENLTSLQGRIGIARRVNLSPREMEVCNLVRDGFTSKDIARLLNISYRTVEKHRKNIRRKLGISGKKINLFIFLTQL